MRCQSIFAVLIAIAFVTDLAAQGRRMEGDLEIVPLRDNLSMLVMEPADQSVHIAPSIISYNKRI